MNTNPTLADQLKASVRELIREIREDQLPCLTITCGVDEKVIGRIEDRLWAIGVWIERLERIDAFEIREGVNDLRIPGYRAFFSVDETPQGAV